MLFERYIGVDYSGAVVANASLKGLRVYAASPLSPPKEVQPPPSPRKYWTRREIAEWLAHELAGGVRTLVGIDHGFSFPLAYFKKYGLPHDWPAFLDDFQRHWPTDQDNLYVDFVRDGLHGHGAGRTGSRKWRRLAEVRTGAKSVFHFDVQGQVAKSTHAGIPWLRYLRNHLGSRVHFWPFDGWDPGNGRSVIAEVYPRLWKGLCPFADLTPDQQDAYAVAAWMRREDQADQLSGHFNPALSDEDRALAEIEGWILGLGGEEPQRERRREPKRDERRERSRAKEAHCPECHIRHDSAGVAWIDETNVTVVEVARLWMAVSQNLGGLHSLLPRLSMGQVHSALAYYEDHRSEVDHEMARSRH